MISYDTLLNEIEKLVATAKNANNEQQVREQLSAIRALCNVALTNEGEKQSLPFSHREFNNHVVQAVLPSQSHTTLNASGSGTKLQENDANGDSIFDF